MIREILERKPASARSLYDMNLRPDCFSPDIIHQSLQVCDILKVNEDELAFAMEMYSLSAWTIWGWIFSCIISAFNGSASLGEIMAYTFTPNGRWDAPADEDPQPIDTVGAGDASASMLAVGYLLNWRPDTVVRRASELAGAICRTFGAIPENSAFYNPYLKWIAEEPDGK